MRPLIGKIEDHVPFVDLATIQIIVTDGRELVAVEDVGGCHFQVRPDLGVAIVHADDVRAEIDHRPVGHAGRVGVEDLNRLAEIARRVVAGKPIGAEGRNQVGTDHRRSVAILGQLIGKG